MFALDQQFAVAVFADYKAVNVAESILKCRPTRYLPRGVKHGSEPITRFFGNPIFQCVVCKNIYRVCDNENNSFFIVLCDIVDNYREDFRVFMNKVKPCFVILLICACGIIIICASERSEYSPA